MKRVIKRNLKRYELAGTINDQVPPFGSGTFQQMYGNGVQTIGNNGATVGSPNELQKRKNLQMGAAMLTPNYSSDITFDGGYTPGQINTPPAQGYTGSTNITQGTFNSPTRNFNGGNGVGLMQQQFPQSYLNADLETMDVSGGAFKQGVNRNFSRGKVNSYTPTVAPMGQLKYPESYDAQPTSVVVQPTAPTTTGDNSTISLSPEEIANDKGLTEDNLSQEQIDTNKDNYKNKTEQEIGQIKNPEKIQFFNPYGAVDIPTAAMTLGSSIESKNALGIVGSGLKLATGLGRNIMGGIGTQRRNDQVMNDYLATQRRDLKRVEMGRDGGYFGDGEFKQFIPEFRSGGEVDLPQALTGEYLGAMDKQNPMQEPNAEIETNEMVQHPSGDIQQAKGDTHEKGGMDVSLEEGTRILSDHLKLGRETAKRLNKDFGLDLKASDTYAKALEKSNKKTGLKKVVDEQEEAIRKLEKQKDVKDEETQGLNTQHLSNKINELEQSKEPLEQEKQEVFEVLFQAQEKSKPKNEQEEEVFKDGGIVRALSEKYGITEERARELTSSMFQEEEQEDLDTFKNGGEKERIRKVREDRLKDFYIQAQVLGYKGDINVKAKDLNKEGEQLQKWMTTNHPQVVAKYAKDAEMTAKGVDMLKSSNPEVFKEAGLDPSLPSTSYSREEKERIKEILGDGLDDKFYTEQFNDGLFDYRYPGAPISGNASKFDNPITAPLLNQPPTTGQLPLEQQVGKGEGNTEEGRDKSNALFLPSQNRLRPDSLQAHLKARRRFDRVNPALISPEENIVELNRQENSVMDSINNVPGAQRAASIASLSSNIGDSINKAYQHSNTFNSQATAQAEMVNARTQAMEENAAAQDALSYEQRQFRAKSLTDNDIRNYYNTLSSDNIKNYNEVNNINAANALAEHYQYDGNNYVQVDTPFFDPNNYPTTEAEKEKAKVKGKKKATAKFGGRFSKKSK